MTMCIKAILGGPLKSIVTVASLGLLLASTSAVRADDSQERRSLGNLNEIKHIIVIYQENWSFDSLYGQFPGADGYANSFDTLPQVDVKAAPAYSSLIYKTPSPLNGAIDPQFPSIGGNLALGSKPNQMVALSLIPYD